MRPAMETRPLMLRRARGETAWWGFATVPSGSGDDVVAIDHGRPVLAEPRVVRVWTQCGDGQAAADPGMLGDLPSEGCLGVLVRGALC